MTRRVPIVVGIVVLGAVAVWWISSGVPNERTNVASALAVAVEQVGDGGSVDLRSVASFEWDHAYLFHAYADDARISRTLGISWGTKGDTRMWYGGTVLVVFVSGQSVTGWTILNHSEPAGPLLTFEDALFERPIARDEATFHISLSGTTNEPVFRLR